MNKFVHLHLHTEYSILSGFARIDRLFSAVKNHGMDAVAITDPSLFGAVAFYTKAKKAGVKPIIGAELEIFEEEDAEGAKDRDNQTQLTPASGDLLKSRKLILFAKDVVGYQNLSALSTLSFSGENAPTMADLKEHAEGLICLSGSAFDAEIAGGEMEMAQSLSKNLQTIFKDDFYIELQRLGRQNELMLNRGLIYIAKNIGAEVVATNNVKYIEPEDRLGLDILRAIADNKLLSDINQSNDQMYLKNPDEMNALFKEVPSAIENTLKIAEKCNFEFDFSARHLPVFYKEADLRTVCYEALEAKTAKSLLEADESDGGSLRENFRNVDSSRQLSNAGIQNIIFQKNSSAKESGGDFALEWVKHKKASEFEKTNSLVGVQPRNSLPHDKAMLRERLDYELDVIYEMGFEDYMLIVQDFVLAAREMGISVGPGRGSAGGSLVTYLLGITEVDPIKHHLIFERFLNPERVSMPDIDIDFENERRDEVVDYVRRTYGSNRVSQINTFGTLSARAAIRDVGKALGIPLYEIDKLAKKISSKPGTKIQSALKQEYSLRKDVEQNDEYKTLFQYAQMIEGVPRNLSTHAAGVVITEKPVADYVPLQEHQTTQYTMEELERLGLLKIDFLGLAALTVIKKTVAYIEERTGRRVDIDEQKDEVYEFLQTARTVGIFQLESPGFRKFLKRLKPTCFDDIVLAISIYRPGPMSHIDEYLSNRQSGKISYDIPQLAPILDETYGVMIFQEQVMRIARDLAGYSYGKSDVLRRAMAKRKMSEMEKERPIFIEGMKRSGVDEAKAAVLFEKMTDFANYAFNKTHAVGYAMLAYRETYLKALYPLEYMCSKLRCVTGSKNQVAKMLNECKRMGIKLLPPSINKSMAEFAIEGDAIRWGFLNIHGVGLHFANAIVRARGQRPFTDFYNFIERMESGEIRKTSVEALIFVGTFDCFGYTRPQLIGQYESIIKYVDEIKKYAGTEQLNLFGENDMPAPAMYEASDYKPDQKAAYEKEYLGIYLDNHPLSKYADKIDEIATMSVADLLELSMQDADSLDGKAFKGIFMVTDKIEKYTKKGDLMAFLKCEDMEAGFEVIAFPRVYEGYRDEKFIAVKGKIQSSEGRAPQLIADRIVDADSIKLRQRKVREKNYATDNPVAKNRNLSDVNNQVPKRNTSKNLMILFSKKEKAKYLSIMKLLERIEKDAVREMPRKMPRENAVSSEENRSSENTSAYRVIFKMKESGKTTEFAKKLPISQADLLKLKKIAGIDNLIF